MNGKPEKTNGMIDYGFFDTPIGVALIAATERGLCALRIGELTDADAMLADLRRDFPRAAAPLRENAPAVQPYADLLRDFLAARTQTFAPRLDVRAGTPFQRAVWAELQRIAPGERISYTELAARIGRPKAVRAVAGACASNGVAIAVPCHRVVRTNGSLAGYRWGKDGKARLLDIEARAAAARRAVPNQNGANVL